MGGADADEGRLLKGGVVGLVAPISSVSRLKETPIESGCWVTYAGLDTTAASDSFSPDSTASCGTSASGGGSTC